MSKKTVFLTGPTGFVGSYLLKIFIENGYKVYALARDKNERSGKERAINAVRFWDKNTAKRTGGNLVVLNGDIIKNNLGLSNNNVKQLVDEVEEIYHCAANTGFNLPIKTARLVNVKGTENVLKLGYACSNKGKLQKINYISTIYVCGDHKGVFDENCLNVGQQFNTTYEKSKYEAELLVEKYRKMGLWINVFRPPIIIGESKTGKVPAFNQALYQTLHIWDSELLKYFPNDNKLRANMVCVDELCESIFKIAGNVSLKDKNYHTFHMKGVTPVELLNISQKILKFKKPIIVSEIEFVKRSTSVQKMLLKYNILFINSKVKLRSFKTNDVLNKLNFKYSVIGEKLLNRIVLYSKREKFGNNN